MAWDEVLAFLDRRSGLLDGVVFSGGEPTRSLGLAGAVVDVRSRGFTVGIHSGGAFPNRLAPLLDVVDWVGLDVKALPEDYPEVVGRPGGGERAWTSLGLVLASGVEHEVRTTIHPGSPATRRLPEIATRLKSAGVRAFALQQARGRGARSGFQAQAPGWDHHVLDLAEQVRSLGFERFELRRAD